MSLSVQQATRSAANFGSILSGAAPAAGGRARPGEGTPRVRQSQSAASRQREEAANQRASAAAAQAQGLAASRSQTDVARRGSSTSSRARTEHESRLNRRDDAGADTGLADGMSTRQSQARSLQVCLPSLSTVARSGLCSAA